MIVVATRAFESLKAVLGRRLADQGEPGHGEAAPRVTLVELAALVGDFAVAGAGETSTEQKQLVRASLLEIAAVCLRSVEAIDKYDLALHWKEHDAAARV